jgi:hypothetical protein
MSRIRTVPDRFGPYRKEKNMPHLNIYLSRERAKWLRLELEGIAQKENRSLSYVVEEALVAFIKLSGKHVPTQQRKDHRSHPER